MSHWQALSRISLELSVLARLIDGWHTTNVY